MPQILHDETGTSYLGMTVAALIFNEAGQVLLIKENYGKRRYGPPGGHIEAGESPKQAVTRESLEEVCVQVQVSRLIGIYQTERKAPGFQPRGEKRVLVWGLGRGNPLPMAHAKPLDSDVSVWYTCTSKSGPSCLACTAGLAGTEVCGGCVRHPG